MNRSFISVILGGFGGGAVASDKAIDGELKPIDPQSAAKLVAEAKSIIVYDVLFIYLFMLKCAWLWNGSW
jgi:NAD/NADP transhydrogenase beta subunit